MIDLNQLDELIETTGEVIAEAKLSGISVTEFRFDLSRVNVFSAAVIMQSIEPREWRIIAEAVERIAQCRDNALHYRTLLVSQKLEQYLAGKDSENARPKSYRS